MHKPTHLPLNVRSARRQRRFEVSACNGDLLKTCLSTKLKTCPSYPAGFIGSALIGVYLHKSTTTSDTYTPAHHATLCITIKVYFKHYLKYILTNVYEIQYTAKYFVL